MPWAPQTSCQHPPVDPDRAAEDVSRLVAHEERDHVRDLLRPTEAIEGHDALEQRLVGALRELKRRVNRGLDAARTDTVDPEALPSILDRKRVGECKNSTLGGRVGSGPRMRLERGRRCGV